MAEGDPVILLDDDDAEDGQEEIRPTSIFLVGLLSVLVIFCCFLTVCGPHEEVDPEQFRTTVDAIGAASVTDPFVLRATILFTPKARICQARFWQVGRPLGQEERWQGPPAFVQAATDGRLLKLRISSYDVPAAAAGKAKPQNGGLHDTWEIFLQDARLDADVYRVRVRAGDGAVSVTRHSAEKLSFADSGTPVNVRPAVVMGLCGEEFAGFEIHLRLTDFGMQEWLENGSGRVCMHVYRIYRDQVRLGFDLRHYEVMEKPAEGIAQYLKTSLARSELLKKYANPEAEAAKRPDLFMIAGRLGRDRDLVQGGRSPLPPTPTPEIVFTSQGKDVNPSLLPPLRRFDGQEWDQEKTEIRAWTDGNEVFFDAMAYDSKPDDMITRYTLQKAVPWPFKDDSFEFFFLPNRESEIFYQVCVSCTGVYDTFAYENHIDHICMNPRPAPELGKVRVSVVKDGTGFRVQLAFPAELLGPAPLRPGASFFMQLVRNYRGQPMIPTDSCMLQLFPSHIYASNEMIPMNHDKRAFQPVVVVKAP